MDRLQTPEFQQRLFSYYGNQSAGAAAFPTRANEIIGELVVNPQGDELGTVKDMVTTESGCVKYLLLSPSEQLAMGSQLIALPWNLIQRDRRQNAVVMNISMQELKDAPAFETQNWRDYVNNPQFDQRVYNYFQAQPGRLSTGALQPQSNLDVVRATTLIGTMVADQEGQPVGTLRDLMMDDRGKIKYLLISSQNDPSRIVAVPWDIADPGIVQNTLIIDVSQDSFLNAPAFSMNNWRRLKSQQWENRVNSYFRPEQEGEYIFEIF
jgi:sporulation protein YlmC with PRC-barrel domain